MSEFRTGIVAFACIHRTLRYRCEDTLLFAVALEDEDLMFIARQQPHPYDREARRIAMCELLRGTIVKIAYELRDGRKWMRAVQVLEWAEEESPFSPAPDKSG